MISETFLNIVFGIVEGLLGLLPNISWDVSTAGITAFVSILRMAFYLLPMDTISRIIGLIISIIAFKIIISLLKTIWDILPLV